MKVTTHLRFEVLTTVVVKIQVLMLGHVDCQTDTGISEHCSALTSVSEDCLTLKMKALCFFKNVINYYQSAWHNILIVKLHDHLLLSSIKIRSSWHICFIPLYISVIDLKQKDSFKL